MAYRGSSNGPPVQEYVPEINFGLEEGEPLALVHFDDRSSEFVINSDTVEAINQYQGNVGVVSLFGKQRTGKSFLLNKLVGSSSRSGV